MEPSSIVLIMAPILFPVAMKLGIDPIHFGIMMVVNMEVGMCHPPVGLNLYVASGITKMGITELTVAVWPWLLTMLVFLVVVTYWPTALDLAAADARDDSLSGRFAVARHGRVAGPGVSARLGAAVDGGPPEPACLCPACACSRSQERPAGMRQTARAASAPRRWRDRTQWATAGGKML